MRLAGQAISYLTRRLLSWALALVSTAEKGIDMKRHLQPIWLEIRKAAAEAPALYFAPLIGALRGIRAQYRELERRNTPKGRQKPASTLDDSLK
jgi:hypothetical protein